MEILATCTKCGKPFKLVGHYSRMKKVPQPVTCPYCEEPNEVEWPMDADVKAAAV